MSSTFALADIIAGAAALSNSPPLAANTRITATQATYWAAQSARSLSALIRQKFPEDRDFIQWAQVSTIPSLPLISLPPDCGEVHSVVWLRGADDAVLLQSAGAQDLVLQPRETGEGWNTEDCPLPVWRLEGQTIGMYPASGLAETIEIFYTTHISPTSGTFQARLDFDRWVELDLCIKISTAKKKTGEIAEFQRQKALLENDLLSRARKRDVAERHVMRNTTHEARVSDWRSRYGG